jgi:hypothetical protein
MINRHVSVGPSLQKSLGTMRSLLAGPKRKSACHVDEARSGFWDSTGAFRHLSYHP